MVVFRDLRTVTGGTKITQAGRAASAKASRASVARDKALKNAGVQIITAPLVVRTPRGERSWVYYEDQAPYQAFEHPGRIVTVGARTGRVRVSKALRWPPLVAGELPNYLQTFERYRETKYRAFSRGWKLKAQPARRASNEIASELPSTLERTPEARASTQAAAAALGVERACTIRFSDSLGDFFDAGAVDRTRAALGRLLAELAPGVVDARYRYRQAGVGTPTDYARSVIADRGCRHVLLYIAGAGTSSGSDPAVAIGVKSRKGGKLETQLVTPDALRSVIDAFPQTGFTLELDAPRSGAFIDAIGKRPNLQATLASSTGDGPAFAALSEVTGADGKPIANSSNGLGYLEFTNRQLRGLGCFLSRPGELAAAQRAVAEGQAPSVLSWLFVRSANLCVQNYLPQLVEGGVAPDIDTTYPAPGDAALNRAPQAADLRATTDEDAPLAITLPGSDPDGDALTYAIVDNPTLGTLAGSGSARTYTPATDAYGEDSFTLTVSDGRLSAGPVRVTIDVRPVNDAPRVAAGAGSAGFDEAGAAVVVDPAIGLTDIDSATITSASATIEAGRQTGDELAFSAQHGITGTYDGATGVLSLTGSATAAEYQDVLRSVTFENAGNALSGTTREIIFRASDGSAVGSSAVRPVPVRVINDAPVLSLPATTVNFVEDDATGVAVAPTLDVSDVDSAFLASATVSISSGFVSGEDELVVAPQAGITANFAAGTLTLTGNVTVSEFQAALRAVRYRNLDTETPTTSPRTISLRVNDGSATANLSNIVQSSVTVQAVNDAPELTAGPAGAVVFNESDPAITVAPALTASDVDSAQLTSARVEITAGAGDDDVLAAPGLPGSLSASWSAATDTLTITGAASAAVYQSALRAVTFDNTDDDNPDGGDRTLSFTASDGEAVNGTSAAVTRTVTVVRVNDAPTLSSGVSTVTFDEDDTLGVVVNNAIVVGDVDNTTLTGATVQIGSGLDTAEDELLFTTQNGITGTYAAATGLLQLSGTATLAEYQTALRSIRYRNTDTANPTTATRNVSFLVNDGSAASNVSTTLVSNVEINPIDDRPTVTLGAGANPAFTEGDAGVAIDGGLTVADVDSTQISEASVQITAGLVDAEDRLAFTDPGGLTGSYTAATGLFRITGNASLATYQTALRSVTYSNVGGDNPTGGSRTLSITVTSGALTSVAVTRSLSVTPVNDAPTLTASGGTVTFTENTASIAVDSGITLADPDDGNFSEAIVSIGANGEGGDVLSFVNAAGITGSWSAGSRTLTLSGVASRADYQAALRTVRFEHTGDTPTANTRTVNFSISDAAGAPAAASRGVVVTPTNDAPVVTIGNATTVNFTEGGSPVVIDNAITVTDPESNTLTGATVAVTANGQNAQDRLAFTPVHGITATYDVGTRALSLTGNATAAQYADALRTVTYENISSSPSVATRTIAFAATDGASSAVVSKQVSITSNNTAPALSGGGNTVNFTEDGSPVAVNPAIAVSDPDDTDIDSATIQITAGGTPGEDELLIGVHPGITSDYTPATGTLTLTGPATLATFQAALRDVGYRNTNTAQPSAAPRTVTFTINDGEADSNPQSTTVNITQAPDAPLLTAGTGNTKTFIEGGTSVAVDDLITVTDVDSTNLTGAEVQIAGGYDAGSDLLSVSSADGISGTYDPADGLLTLNGTSSVANYQAALRRVQFSSSSENPTSTRLVNFRATDGAANSSTVGHQVLLQNVNDAPALGSGGTLNYTENDAAAVISPSLTLTDVDGPQISGATVSVSSGYQSGQDVLSFVNGGGITGSWNAATGILTLSGNASAAGYQAALRTVRYVNTSENPSETPRTLTYTATDTGTPIESGSTTATINVTAVNDAPVVVADTSSTFGNTRLHYGTTRGGDPGRVHVSGNVLTNDTDVDGPGALTVNVPGSQTTPPTGGSVSWNANGSFNYDPPAGFTGNAVLTYAVTDGQASGTGSVTVNVGARVWYVDNAEPDGGTGRSGDPFDTLAEADAAADAAGDRIYVHEGNSTTTKLGGGVTLLANQQLIGEAQDLVVSGETLFDSQPTDRPTISGSVAVDDGNTVHGLTIQSQSAAAAAIDGGAGDAGGTLDDLTLTAGGSGGSGLVLSGTTGTWNVSNVTASSSGASSHGINISNNGDVNFASGGTISVASTTGAGVTISGATTNLSGVIDSVTTTSASSGVAVTSNLGSLTLSTVSLNTTGPGLTLNSTRGISVPAGTINAGGTGVDLSTDAGANGTTPPSVTLTSLTSTGGAHGLRVTGIGSGTFSAGGGTLSGHSIGEVTLGAGNGDVSYGGAIGDGTGYSASVTGRSGGTVDLSGNISDTADAGGGIATSGNSAGTVNFSGASKVLNTGASTGVDLAWSAGTTNVVNFTGGGLGITTTSGLGFSASGAGGTLSVQGNANTISSGSGGALRVSGGPQFTNNNATFRSISSNAAPSGIVLANTGSSGGLRVIGAGGTGTGGTIQDSTGPGIDLTNTRDVQLGSVTVHSGDDDGIRGSGVNGLALTSSSRVTDNGNAVTERGIDMTELSGTVALTGLTATGNAEDNVAIVNDAATISSLDVLGGTYGNNSAAVGNDGILVQNTGTGNTTGSIRNAAFVNNRGDHIQVVTDNSTTSTQRLMIQNNELDGTGNQGGNTMVGGGIALGAGGDATQRIVVDNNDIERAYSSAISLNLAGLTNTADSHWTVTNNSIGTVGEALSGSFGNSGIYYNVNGNGTATSLIANNDIRQTAFTAIDVVNNDGDANVYSTIRGNTIAEPRVPVVGQPSTYTYTYGLRFILGSDGADNGDGCLDLGGAGSDRNSLAGTGQDGFQDVRVRVAGDDNDLQLAGYAGGVHDNAAVNTLLTNRNNRDATPTVSASKVDAVNSTWLPAASCTLPTAP